MNAMMTSSWSVRFELPRDEAKDRKWSVSMAVTVIADTVERATAVVRHAHADAVIFSVNHKGKTVTYVDEDALVDDGRTVVAGQKCPDQRNYPGTHRADDLGRCSFCAARVLPSESLDQEKP